MFAIPGILLLLGLVYGRPQELVQALLALPLFPLAFALGLFGWAIDLRLRKTRPAFAPADGAVLAYMALLFAGVALARPDELRREAGWLLIPLGVYFLLAHAVQSFRAFQTVAGMVLALVIYLGAVGVHEGLAPFGCHVLDPQSQDAAGRYDGPRCDTRRDCEQGDAEVDAEYVCE